MRESLSAALHGLKAQQVHSPGQRPGYHVPHSLRPVRAKVKANHSPILLPLQGVGVYTLIPRALPWAVDWLPFQGAPVCALFVYDVRMLRRYVIWFKTAQRFFLGFEHPTFQGAPFALCSFIMCVCFATFCLAKKTRRDFPDFEHPSKGYFRGVCHLHSSTNSLSLDKYAANL